MVPLETLGMVSYSTSIATMAVSLTRFDTIHERDERTLHDGTGCADAEHRAAKISNYNSTQRVQTSTKANHTC